MKYTYIVAIATFLFTALVFALTSICTENWIEYKVAKENYHSGLWHICKREYIEGGCMFIGSGLYDVGGKSNET